MTSPHVDLGPMCPQWCADTHDGEEGWEATHHTGLVTELSAVGAVDHGTYDVTIQAQTWGLGESGSPLVAIPEFDADLSIDGARRVAAALLATAEWLEAQR